MRWTRGSARAATFAACAVAALTTAAPAARAEEPPPEDVCVVGDAVRDPVAPRDPGVASSVIPRERLQGPGLEAQDVLRAQPGIAVSESGGFGAPATAAVRGATAADTPVYLAGVRLNDDVAGTADLSMVPLWLVERVEVYRGNAPVDADRLGPGGAIFFEPRRPTRDLGGAGFYGGSWGASKGWAYQALHGERVSALVGVSADRATNRYPFVNDQGTLFEPQNAATATRENADERTLDGWGIARVDLGRGASVDVVANGITREQGVPSLALLPTRRARETSDRALVSIAARAPAGERVVVDARTSLLAGSTAYADPLTELSLYTTSLRITGRRVDETVGATIDVGDRARLRPVIEVAREQIDRDPDDIPIGRAHREVARAAVAAEDRVADGLLVRALASGECHHTGARAGATCDVLEPTGRVGLEVGEGRVRLLGNAGRYVRVPTLGEVYGVVSTVHGNPSLAPETGLTADVGVRAQTARDGAFDGAFVDAFAFARWADGLIAYERAGQGYVLPYNVGRARVLGAEILGGAAFFRWLRAEVAATLLDPRDTSADRTTVNDVLPFRSRLVLAPRVRGDWKRPSREGPSAWGASLGAVVQSSRYVDPAGLGVIDAQTSVDADAYVTWWGGVLTTRARVADLTGAVRTDVVGYPLPGRSVYFGMEATW